MYKADPSVNDRRCPMVPLVPLVPMAPQPPDRGRAATAATAATSPWQGSVAEAGHQIGNLIYDAMIIGHV